jgi:hypothetical protein
MLKGARLAVENQLVVQDPVVEGVQSFLLWAQWLLYVLLQPLFILNMR